MMSPNPSVAISATEAPRRSNKALVATVVPCASTPGRIASPVPTTMLIPSATATDGSSGVDGTFTIVPSSAPTWVNVPPVPTPPRRFATTPPPSADGFDDPHLVLAEVVLQRTDQPAHPVVVVVPDHHRL